MTALAQNTSTTITLQDGGLVNISTNGGIASVTATPTGGAAQSQNLGPLPTRLTVGPFAEGGTVTIFNQTAVLDYDRPYGNVATYSVDSSGKATGLVGPTGEAISLGGARVRSSTYFALRSMDGGDWRQTDASSTPIVVTSVTDMNSCNPYRVVRRAGRFRAVWTNGTGGASVAAIRIKATVEVPVKNGSGTLIIPLQFNSQDTVDLPANAGRIVYSDWVTYPLEPNDLVVVKGYYVAPAGGAFNALTVFHGSDGTTNPAGAFSSARVNTATDSTGVAYLSGTWASANFAGSFKEIGIETDSFIPNQLTTVDLWGDSIIAGTSTTYIQRTLKALNIPYASFGLSGSSQVTLPASALARMNLARGDIAFCNHGHNSIGSTAALGNVWKMLRQLGYRKIIQTLITEDFSSTDSYATTANQTRLTDATAMNAYILANKGVGDGPDAVWDIPSIAQPGRKWVPLWTTDGIHPSSTGEAGIDAGIRAAGWQSDLT
jgi:hypothetical protein